MGQGHEGRIICALTLRHHFCCIWHHSSLASILQTMQLLAVDIEEFLHYRKLDILTRYAFDDHGH